MFQVTHLNHKNIKAFLLKIYKNFYVRNTMSCSLNLFPKWMPFFKKLKFLQSNVAGHSGHTIKFEDLKATENRVLNELVLIRIMTIISLFE